MDSAAPEEVYKKTDDKKKDPYETLDACRKLIQAKVVKSMDPCCEMDENKKYKDK